MRVVGYVRESGDPSDPRPAFAQQEEIRRYVTGQGDQLVAVCQDTRQPGHALSDDGYLSLLGVIDAGGVEAVVVAGLDTLSADHIVQEIRLWDLRSRGIRVISTDGTEAEVIGGEQPGPTRMFIRDVLKRVGEHVETVRTIPPRRRNGVTVQLEKAEE